MYIFWLPPDYEDRITLRPPGVLVSRPRTLIFWPIGLSAALSVSEHWRSPTDRGGDGVGGARGCRTLGKRSEVMHFSIRFWLTFFFTKMDTQCSITSWISVPLKACGQVRGWWEWPRPFHWKEAGHWNEEEGLREHCWSLSLLLRTWWQNIREKKRPISYCFSFLSCTDCARFDFVQVSTFFFFPFLYRL